MVRYQLAEIEGQPRSDAVASLDDADLQALVDYSGGARYTFFNFRSRMYAIVRNKTHTLLDAPLD